jgi:hypothetical protein
MFHGDSQRPFSVWPWAIATFVAIAAIQLTLVRFAGTDIPFLDQWDVEGHWLYPAWHDGAFHLSDAFKPSNENRIAWTILLDLVLFAGNGGQWDPLVQMFCGALLRAVCGTALVWMFGRAGGRRARPIIASLVVVAFLPHLAWHNALWGIETHAYFVVGFALLTFVLLEPETRPAPRTALGLVSGVGAFVAMAPGSLVPVALLALALVRAGEARSWRVFFREMWPGAVLLVIAFALRVHQPAHATLEPTTIAQFVLASGRSLAWPHVSQPIAALVLNAPLAAVAFARVLCLRRAAAGEDFALLLGFWGAAVAVAIGWARGGSPELMFGVPSRYVDFLVMLPIANAWCAFVLLQGVVPKRRTMAVGAATAWALFLGIGWVGLSTETVRFVVWPRMRDRDAPVRLATAFQRTRDAVVFAGQPRLLIPHTDLESITRVLDDPRMHGALPPSLQPGMPMGRLSRFVRFVLRR